MTVRVIHGDCLDILPTLPDASVQCCVTSPPYYGLRSYLPDGHRDKHLEIGLEPSPDEYISKMVQVFREVRRALRDDGTLWLNIGDSYAASRSYQVTDNKNPAVGPTRHMGRATPPDGLKQKDLIGIPWMVAFALRADGWYLRSDIIWAKRNCMPESVRDRPTRAHEYLFLLTKQPRYYYDATAIEEDGDIPAGTRAAKGSNVRSDIKDVNGRPPEYWEYNGKRNKRSVWWLATKPFAEAHFATFPPDLVEPCILAGTSERGCCPACGAPWERLIERRLIRGPKACRRTVIDARDHAADARDQGSNRQKDGHIPGLLRADTTKGWQPNCACPAHKPIPCTVLDPFGGAGTTGLIADRLGRHATLIELNPEYARMAGHRVRNDAPLFAEVS